VDSSSEGETSRSDLPREEGTELASKYHNHGKNGEMKDLREF
jgi:hypothetical protein